MRFFLYSLLFAGGPLVVQAQTSPSLDRADFPVVGDTLRLSQAAPLLPATAPGRAPRPVAASPGSRAASCGEGRMGG